MRRAHELKDRLQFSILNSGKVIKQRERKGEKEPAREARARDAAADAATACALAPGRILAFVKPRGTELGPSVLYLVPRALPCLVLPACLAFLACVVSSSLAPVLLSARGNNKSGNGQQQDKEKVSCLSLFFFLSLFFASCCF